MSSNLFGVSQIIWSHQARWNEVMKLLLHMLAFHEHLWLNCLSITLTRVGIFMGLLMIFWALVNLEGLKMLAFQDITQDGIIRKSVDAIWFDFVPLFPSFVR